MKVEIKYSVKMVQHVRDVWMLVACNGTRIKTVRCDSKLLLHLNPSGDRKERNRKSGFLHVLIVSRQR
jgi:hypothetical protein